MILRGILAALVMGGTIVSLAAIPFEPMIRAQAGDRWAERAAQLKAESGWNPKAVSPVGARGLAQFMPATWEWAKTQGWVQAHEVPEDPAAAIRANHSYMVWLEARTAGKWDRALGAYNAGLLNVRRALAHAERTGMTGETAWLRALPAVTGRHAAETQGYVARCYRYRDEFKGVNRVR